MNYLDYKRIMEEEGLTLPKVAEYTLEKAKECQRTINKLKEYNATAQIKTMEAHKTRWIMSAIEWARMAKENPAVFNWSESQIKRMERK